MARFNIEAPNLTDLIYDMDTMLQNVTPDPASAYRRLHDLAIVEELLLSLSGIASTSLIAMIFAWNGAFWSLNLTATNAAPLTAFIASFPSPEGLFWAKLSAASTLAIAPILMFGWLSQIANSVYSSALRDAASQPDCAS